MLRGAHPRQISRLLLFLSALELLFAAGGAAALRIGGIVQDSEGVAVAGVTVSVYDYDVPDFSAEFLGFQDTTDIAGHFEMEVDGPGDALLLLRGDQGAGRIKIAVTERNESLRLSYPVRTEIVLLHDNDLHFNFNHLEAFRASIEEYRDRCPNVFLLNAGDILIRHPDRWPCPGENGYYASASFMIETMNDIGYDAMTVGNHELDYIGDLTRRAMEKAQFPFLGANIEISTGNLPPLKSYIVLATEERYSVAVLGLSNFSKEGVSSVEPVETAKRYRFLTDSHDVFTALTHIGNSADRRLAAECDFLDVIIGGHTHGLLEQAEKIGGVLFARAGGTPGGHPVDPALPKFLGVVKIVMENGRIVEKNGHVETFSAVPVEAELEEKIAPGL
ncbi:MAG TPA: hypothetical protein ENN29_01790 [Candidatus Hydrogenedentes bacterium]|nr:hypothetical protein [Candidatus Hydrogenedentota bacterium]